jgi:hypothetical protein
MMYFVVRPEGAALRESRGSGPELNAPPRVRDRMVTAEYDLSEFARLHTGPSSWSAEPERDDPRRNDVVRLADNIDDDEDLAIVDEREAYVLSLVGPEAKVADVLDLAGMPASEIFAILGSLVTRGVLSLERHSGQTPIAREVTPASR